MDVERGDRVTCLRHGRGGAAAFMERLEYFGDFGLHQELHVHRDLAERAGEQAEKAADLTDAVAYRVPGDLGLAELELGHQAFLHLEAVLAERRECADRACELADQNTRAQL